jgi:hypothetical protein
MAKGPGVSATSHIDAQSQTNIHYYSDLPKRLQHKFYFYTQLCLCPRKMLANRIYIKFA